MLYRPAPLKNFSSPAQYLYSVRDNQLESAGALPARSRANPSLPTPIGATTTDKTPVSAEKFPYQPVQDSYLWQLEGFKEGAQMRPAEGGYEIIPKAGSGLGPVLVKKGDNGDFKLTMDQPNLTFESTFTPSKNGGYQEKFERKRYPTTETTDGPVRSGEFNESYTHYKDADGQESTIFEKYSRRSDEYDRTRRVRQPGYREDSNITFDSNNKPVHGDSLVLTNEDDGSSTTTATQYRAGGSVTTMAERDGKGKVDYSRQTVDGFNGDRQIVNTTTQDGKLLDEKRYFESDAPDRTLPGIPFLWDNCPSQLKGQLPKGVGVSTTRREDFVIGRDGSRYKTTTRKMQSDDESVIVTGTSKPDGGSIYDLKKLGSDGLYDEQYFVQGSKDTVVTNRSRENGFQVERRIEKWPTLSRKDDKFPKLAEKVTYDSDQASVAQLNSLIDTVPGLKGVRESDAFTSFMSDNKDGNLKVMAATGRQEKRKAGVEEAGSLILEDSSGRRLLASYDPEAKTYAVSRQSAKGEYTQATLMAENNGAFEKLEIRPDGSVDSYKKASELLDQGHEWLKTTEDVINGPSNLRKLGETTLKRIDSNRLDKTARPMLARLPKQGLPEVWEGRLNSGLAAFSFLSLGANIANGDTERVRDSAAALSIDAGAVLQEMKFLNSGGMVAKWTGMTGKALGAAGFALQVPGIYENFAEGRPASGALGAASLGGSIMAYYGAGTSAGPIGWGVATAATLATLPVEYNNSTQIASVEI